MPQRHGIVIRCLGLIGLLAAIVLAVDLGAAGRMILSADRSLVFAGLAFVQLQIILSALRWRFTAARLGHEIRVSRAIGEYYLASLLNLVLPGGIGGDAVRTVRAHASAKGDPQATPSAILRAVVLERLAGQVAFFAFTVAGLAAWPLLIDAGLPPGAFATLALVLLLMGGGGLAVLGLGRHAPQRLRSRFAGLGPDVRKAWFARRAWIVQGLASLTIAALYIIAFAVASAAVGAPLPWPAVFAFVPLVLLTMLLPISVGGFGLREGAAAALWPLAGFDAAQGVAAAFLYGLLSLAGSLPGLIGLFGRQRVYASNRP